MIQADQVNQQPADDLVLPELIPDFRGRTAIVTGSGQGIGRCIALSFAIAGARVCLADIDTAAGEATCSLIAKRGGNAEFIRTDVANEADVQNLVLAAAQSGGIDFLINNAAIAHAGAAHVFSDSVSAFDRVLAVNLRGPFLCARSAIPHMQGPGGAIINITSTRAVMSEARTEAYAASKGGLVALTHALSVSLENSGIRVNCISPGWIDTSGWRDQIAGTVLSDEDHRQHPAGRVGRPADIASACLWLCSADTGFITGAHFVIDGGMTRKMIYVP
jgi:NAD(P)-dependent dehydrogenase (short-subunit alcohol dehydrogenase family)